MSKTLQPSRAAPDFVQAVRALRLRACSRRGVLEGLMHVESRPQALEIVRSLGRYHKLVDEGKANSDEGRALWAALMQWGGSWEPEPRRLEIQRRMVEASRRS